jgi:hypothetical protein
MLARYRATLHPEYVVKLHFKIHPIFYMSCLRNSQQIRLQI